MNLQCENYQMLQMVQGGLGLPDVRIGAVGQCRFCGNTGSHNFKHVAHTLPEAFGNKWITSLDECDMCNARFGAFDDALVKSMGSILTFGGILGKRNKVRQTGRSSGSNIIRHAHINGQRSISINLKDVSHEDCINYDINTDEFILKIPSASERFIPVRAYKALVKMGVALLPLGEIPQFSRLIAWLDESDAVLLPFMTVGISFANIGNPPPIATAALLRRSTVCCDIPYTIFVTCMGSVCLQILLKSDMHDGGWPSPLRTRPNICWRNVLRASGREPIVFEYGMPSHLDWGRVELEPPLIEAVFIRVHAQTQQTRISSVLRSDAIAPPVV